MAAIALVPGWSRGPARIVIGAKTFAEQYILAALIGQRLTAANIATGQREGLGSSVIFDALANDDIDVYVDYTGTLWANAMKRKDVKPRAEVLADVGRWLRRSHGITMLGWLGFENAYALAMKRERAEALGIRTIADLAAHARQMTIAGDYEFFARPEWACNARCLWPRLQATAADAGGVHVSGRRRRRGRRDLGVLQRRADREIRSRRAGGRQARHPAL